MSKSKNVVIVADAEYVECPYCPRGPNNQFKRLHWMHMKVKHGKQLSDLKIDFPTAPTITRKEYNRQIETARKGKESFIKNLDEGKTKVVKCYYNDDSDCEHGERNVAVNAANYYFCTKCQHAGKENPDGRTKEHANEEREKTLTNKYGKNVRNANQVPGSIEKTRETCNEKYGGIGFAGSKGKESREITKNKYGDENIMKTEGGYLLWKEGIIKSSGYDNPLKNPIVAKKVSITKTGQPSKLKGREYDEIHGEEKAKELREEKKISGAKGYLKSRRISKPQIDLYKLIDTIWDTCMLDYPVLNYYLDISIGEIKLDFEYDATFFHEYNTESDKIRAENIGKFEWKTVRFLDRLPSKEEIEKIIEDRIIEAEELKITGINSFEDNYLIDSKRLPLDKYREYYILLKGTDSEILFKKRILILHKIIANTYNQVSYEDLVNLWYYYIEDKENGSKYLDCVKYS